MFPIQKSQVVTLFQNTSMSRDQDYEEALEALKSRPRLAVFKAWLSPTADEESRQQHISRVAELARLQDDRHRGFLVISEPILGRGKESSDALSENILGTRF